MLIQSAPPHAPSTPSVLEQVDPRRVSAFGLLDTSARHDLGQYSTPVHVARHLVALFSPPIGDVRLLDPGAGVGSLTAAFVDRALASGAVSSIEAHFVEIDPALLPALNRTIRLIDETCRRAGVPFHAELHEADFIEWAPNWLEKTTSRPFTHCIMNPPYGKLGSKSRHRALLDERKWSVPNYYAGFVGLATDTLQSGGELAAITPRSFCNGSYFRRFRQRLHMLATLDKVHIYDSRDRAFAGDGVLQETVLFRYTRCGNPKTDVSVIVSSGCAEDTGHTTRSVPRPSVISPATGFIHIIQSDEMADVAHKVAGLSATLPSLGLKASTGRVVSFRARELLTHDKLGAYPLLHPCNVIPEGVVWPLRNQGKPVALTPEAKNRKLLIPNGNYALVKRFSSKEQNRRLSASLLTGDQVTKGLPIGLENHLNYVHCEGGGLELALARGVVAYLNSSLADTYFRAFSGHTQVNAGDLNTMPFPNREQLLVLSDIAESSGTQTNTDVDEALEAMCAD